MENKEMMNYDPNLTNSGNMATQQVKLVFGQWEYRTEMIVQIGGNCTGISVIKAAVSRAYDELPYKTYEGNDYAEIVLKKSNGDTLSSEDEDLDGEDWLGEMLISAEIISITPDKGDK